MKLSKTYSPKDFETNIYDLWEKSGVFEPRGKGKPFTMVIPPPNANASLHVGHALNFAIMDIIVRYQRANGKKVLFLPGADHAGFETQVVYEKHLAKEGKSRFDFSREQLYGQIWDFVQENKDTFEAQLRSFGASVDWTRFTFTLDDKVVATSYATFKKLWDDQYIYRGERLVNYCTTHRTGFADIEVAHEDRITPLYYLKYGPFTLATTRPETKFGDTAVAVHPEDERYKQYVGQTITVEGLNGPFDLQVVADDYVDPEFGTGAVKITPAHDFNDWDIAQRHNLPAVKVINYDGTMNDVAGKYAGLTVVEARKQVVADLDEKGLLVKVDKKYKNRVGTCYKCGTVIEPMLLDQWFIDMKQLAAPAIAALKDKKVDFYPEQKRDQTIQYLENVRDWNISRQIAWGIPIPAYQNVDNLNDWLYEEDVSEETIERDGKTYKRDSDVFDTWFSSGQWPFAVLGYPENDDYKDFYPTTLMETGIDILYQWVARMLCLGIYVTGDVPFKQVYLHGMVRSEDGRKMSKSLGNVISPHTVIDEFGSDALRMGMVAGRSAGDSAAYAPAKVIAGRNFCNKLWNMARFTEGLLENKPGGIDVKPVTPADHWMLSKIQRIVENYSSLMEDYRISECFELVYHFVWDDVADWYIETSKHEVNPGVLRYVLDTCLRLAHPFAPFVTEAIWQTLDWTDDTLLASQQLPETHKFDEKRAAEFEAIRDIVIEVRTIIADMKLKKTSLYYSDVPFLDEHSGLIAGLAKIDGVQSVADGRGLHLTETPYDCWLDVDRETTEEYVTKLVKRREEAVQEREALEKRLSNESYIKKAPKALVDDTRAKLAAVESLIVTIDKQTSRFQDL